MRWPEQPDILAGDRRHRLSPGAVLTSELAERCVRGVGMTEAVRTHGVALIQCTPDQFGVPLSVTADAEEGRLDVELREGVQDTPGRRRVRPVVEGQGNHA